MYYLNIIKNDLSGQQAIHAITTNAKLCTVVNMKNKK
jgi:hypothetical protein